MALGDVMSNIPIGCVSAVVLVIVVTLLTLRHEIWLQRDLPERYPPTSGENLAAGCWGSVWRIVLYIAIMAALTFIAWNLVNPGPTCEASAECMEWWRSTTWRP